MSLFRRAGAAIARFFTSAADPAAAAGELQLYSKDVGGESQLFARSDAGTISQLTPIATPAAPTPASNLLRNSGFWFAQRQSPGSNTTYNSATVRRISADGWGITNENASAQYQRTDTIAAPEVNLQSRYYGRFTKSTSTGKLEITQGVEASDSQNVRGRTVRVQVQMRGLVAASALWNVGLVQYIGGSFDPGAGSSFFTSQNANGTDPTLDAIFFSYLTPNGAFPADGGTIVGNKIQATITNDPTWVRVGGCFDVPTTAKNLYVVIWSDSQVAVTNGIAIGQAHLVDSTEIQDWSPLSVEEELARVQRYYSKSFNVDTAPVNGQSLGRVLATVTSAGATAQRMGFRLPVTMLVSPAITPTLAIFNPGTGTAGQVKNLVTDTDATGTNTTRSVNALGADFDFTGEASWVVGQPVAIQYTIDTEI